MLEASAIEIDRRLSDGDLLLDVGGWAKPFARADWVLDLMPYETRGLYGYDRGSADDERFSGATWVTRDVCGREPWPFEDDKFDFAICSHTLEDLRDPVWVCQELCRVALAGYVEVPARVEELTYGVHGPWVGWSHHRWLIAVPANQLEFIFKSHAVHGRDDFHLPAGYCDLLAPEARVETLWWEGRLEASERVFIGPDEHDAYLAEFVEDRLHERPAPRRGRRRRRG